MPEDKEQAFSVEFMSQAEPFSIDWFIDAYTALGECAVTYDVSVIAGIHENDRLNLSDHFFESRHASVTLALGMAERLRSTYESIILEAEYGGVQ